jgi:hypothetical protein
MPGQQADNLPQIAYCDLLADSQNNEGKSVLTTASVQSTFHDVTIYDPTCKLNSAQDLTADMDFPDDCTASKLSKKLPKLLRHDSPAQVSFAALFSAKGPHGMIREKYHFTLIRLISVEAYRSKNLGITRRRTDATRRSATSAAF